MSSDAKESDLKNSSTSDTSNISNMISRDVGASKDFAKRHEADEKSETTSKDGTRTAGNIMGISSEAPIAPNDEQKNNDSASGDNNNNNNNSAQRATKVICRQIDSDRLKKSGLHIQIAQALLKKAMQKPHHAQQYSIRQHEQNEKATTIHLDTITTSTNKKSCEGGVTISDKKPVMLTSLPSSTSTGLSVPKITITSPPCDTKTEMLKDSKNNRLEDVKRILNRQILMRKLSNPAGGSSVSMQQNSYKERPEMEKTTLQLPSQTIIKSIKRIESTNATISTVSTTKTNNTFVTSDAKMVKSVPPVITVRKFHAIAAPQVILKPITTTCTISSATSQQQKMNPMVNIVADKNVTSTVRVLTKQGFQKMPTTQTIPSLPSNKLNIKHSSSIPILAHRAVRSTVVVPTNSIQSRNQIVTIPTHFIESVSKGQDTNSHQSPKSSSSLSSSDMSSCHTHTHISSATTSSRYKVLHTISTSKPKIFEIHHPKRLKEEVEEQEEQEEQEQEQEKAKSNYELKSKRLRLSEGISTVSAIPLKALPNITFCPSVSFEAPKRTDRIIKIPKQQSIETEDERARINSKSMSKTENLPIVLENKLLQPDEQIDLKGLCLNRTKLADGHTLISQKQQLPFNSANPNDTGKQAFLQQKSDSNSKSPENRKMHIIISNEKLKSRKFDMAALAKQVLQRATKRISGDDDDDGEQSPKHKPKISKASIDLLKKESICSPLSPQKAILRRKILDLCGIQDDAHLSPIREYPKTVEIIEDCDTSEYDDEGPTAVDFIASLALSGFDNESSSSTAAVCGEEVNDYGVQLQPEIESNANEIKGEAELEKESLGAVGADEVNHYGVQPKPEIQTNACGISEETEMEKESLGAVGADEVNNYGDQPQPEIQSNANEIKGEAELEKESLGAVGADEVNHYGVQPNPEIQPNASGISGEAELEKESLGAVGAYEVNHYGVQPNPEIQPNASGISGEAELEKESLGAVGADEVNHYGVQPKPEIESNANEIKGEAELEKESLGAVGADEVNHYGVQPKPEIQTNASGISEEAEMEKESLGAVGADEVNNYGDQPQPEIQTNASGISEEAEMEKESLGAVGADEVNNYGDQPQPEIQSNANEISGEADLEKKSLGAVGGKEGNHYGVQPKPEIQTNASGISEEAEMEKESLGAVGADEVNNYGDQPQPEIQTNASGISEEAEMEKESLGAVGADEVNNYGDQPQPEIQSNANEISGEADLEKKSLGAVGGKEGNHYGVQPKPEIESNANEISGEAELEKKSLGAVSVDEVNHYGDQLQPDIQTNANEISGEAELEKESLGAVGADEVNHYGDQLQPDIQTNANEISGEAELEKESLGAVGADEVNHYGDQLQPDIQTNANEISEEAKMEEESVGDGAVKQLITTIGKRLCNQETVGQDNNQIKIVDDYETKIHATKAVKTIVEKTLDSSENCEASLEERSSIESNLENIQKISTIIETTSNQLENISIIAETIENLTTVDTPESSFKHETKNKNESKSLFDDKKPMKEISASFMEITATENCKVDNSIENKSSEKKQEDALETDKRSEITNDNTLATKNIARKRIGIRNAPINLITRKKPTQKKPIKSQKIQSEQSITIKTIQTPPSPPPPPPETKESVIVTEEEKSSSLDVRGDESILYAEESIASNQSQQEMLVETSTNMNTNEDDNMSTRKIVDVNSVTENKSNRTDILMISTDSSKTPPISLDLIKECEMEYIQKQMKETSSKSTDKQDTTFDDVRTETTTCQRSESGNNKDECKKIEEEKDEIVEIVASFPIADTSQSNRTSSLIEVGAIIDMKAYGIDQQIETEVPETLSIVCDNELRNNSKLKHPNDNDNDNGQSGDDSQIELKTNRKHLRRKKRICRILSSSESDRETNEPMESFSNESLHLKTIALNDECISSTSNGSDLFGFATQQQTEFQDIKKDVVKNIEDDCANTMESISSSTTKIVSKLSMDKSDPFVNKSTGCRSNNIPLKKRWELSNSNKHKTSYDDDITDDPTPDDDDTMDNQDIASKSIVEHHDINDDNDERGKNLIENQSSHFELIAESISKETVTPPADEMNTIQEIDNSNLTIKAEEIPASRKRSRTNKKTILSDSEKEEDDKVEIKEQTEGDFFSIPTTSTPVVPNRRRRGGGGGRQPKKVKIVEPQACKLESFELKTKDDDSIHGLDTSNTVLKKRQTRKAKSGSSSKVLEMPNKDENVSLEHQMPTIQRKSGRNVKPTVQWSTKEVKKSQTNDDDDDVVKRQTTDETNNENAMDETKMKKKRGRKKQTPAPPEPPPSSQEKTNIDNETMQLEEHSSTIDAANDNVPVVVTKKKCGRKPKAKCISLDIQQSIKEEIEDTSTITTTSTTTTTTPVIPKKRGRKPRVVTTTTEIGTQNPIDTTQDVNTNETIEAPKRKRQSIVGDFNPRFLLIRHREQLDTEEILTVDENERGNGPLQCGLCLARTTQSNWNKHLGEHYGIGWIVDKEPAIDITTRSTILSRIIAYFKQMGKQTQLTCRICARHYKSPLGLLLHMESCGDTIRVECPFCEQKYTKLSYIVHQRTCQKAKKCANEGDANDEENTNETVLSNTGRLKRAAQIRAETKLKNLTTELSNEAKFEPKDFIKCRENQTGEAEFHCTECKSSFQTEDDAISHVIQYHKSNENSKRNCDADGSDYDGNNEMDFANRASTTESDASSVDSDSDGLASPNIKLKVKKTKLVPKRSGSLPIVYSQRVRDVPKLVLRKWKQFIGSNYTTNMLYPYAMPIYSDEEQSRAKEQISSPEFESMNFAFSDSEMHFKPLGGSSTNNQDWQKLRRFESMDQKSSDKLVCLGSPIKGLAWVPLTDDIPEQYLVVSCRKSLNSFTRYSKPKSEVALLFIYKIEKAAPSMKDSKTKNEKGGFSAKIHYILQIRNGPVHTMAFLPSGGYDAGVNRLGLLAIGTATSDIEVIALPIQPEQFDEMKIDVIDETVRVVSLMPAFKLVLDASNTEATIGDGCHPLSVTQCSHICWSEFSGHQHIFSSYVHGYIAIWDIKEPADSFYNLNCHMQAGIRLFTPLTFFYFGEKIINSFAVHYDTNGARWLAVMGSARKHIVYDIRNLTNPITLKEEFLRNVPRDIDWNPVWEPYTAAFCDAIPNHGHCVLAISPVSIVYTHARMEYMLCGVSTVHYNPWQCVYCVGVDNGDIIYVNTRELHHDLQVLLRTNSNVMAVSELDIKRLDGEEIVRINSNGNPHNWRMYEKDYKEKYGLVFTNISKFKTSDRKAYLSEERIPPRNLERYMRISTVRWNLNAFGKNYVAIGYDNGFLRLMRFKREAYFD